MNPTTASTPLKLPRNKVGLGEMGDFFVGAGLGDGLQRVYIAPVGQAEVGYGRFGVRETAVI